MAGQTGLGAVKIGILAYCEDPGQGLESFSQPSYFSPAMSSPFFSVIIPTFNRAGIIRDAVESVLNQSFSDFEVIVVDDGSTDDTPEVLKIYASEPRFRLLIQENARESAARNNGIRNARGEFMCFLDSDDLFLPEHLSNLHAAILSHNSEPAFYFSLLLMQTPDGKRKPAADEVVTEGGVIELLFRNRVNTISACMHRSIFEKHMFREDIYVDEDSEFFYRVAASFPLHCVKSYTSVHRWHESNTDQFYGRSPEYYANRLISLKIYHETALIRDAFPKNKFQKDISKNLQWRAHALVRQQRWKEARRDILSAFRYDFKQAALPGNWKILLKSLVS